MPDEHAELEIITRRTLLAAGTGLLASDSGLLLPEWYLPDAEARAGGSEAGAAGTGADVTRASIAVIRVGSSRGRPPGGESSVM